MNYYDKIKLDDPLKTVLLVFKCFDCGIDVMINEKIAKQVEIPTRCACCLMKKHREGLPKREYYVMRDIHNHFRKEYLEEVRKSHGGRL